MFDYAQISLIALLGHGKSSFGLCINFGVVVVAAAAVVVAVTRLAVVVGEQYVVQCPCVPDSLLRKDSSHTAMR